MCELLGMSSNHRTTINISLTKLSERGEAPSMHGDGWGVAFYDGPDVRLIKDGGEAKDSEWVKFIKEQEIRSHDVIAHIRKSTIGKNSYTNSHPFVRELYGRMHTFAHNGTLKGIFENPKFETDYFNPVGDTDSERAFCVLMDRLRHLWQIGDHIPSLLERVTLLQEFAEEMRQMGPANFLYSDGVTLFAHGHHRHDPVTDKIEWPGLNYIQKKYVKDDHHFEESSRDSIALLGIENDMVTLFASVPLNDEEWIPLKEGEILAVSKGEICFSGQRFS